MIRLSDKDFRMEEGEPSLRRCWECNPAHQPLKDDICERVFSCFDCGRYWVFGRFINEFNNDEELFYFLNERFDKVNRKAGLDHEDKSSK